MIWRTRAAHIFTNLYFERDFWRTQLLISGADIPIVGPELTGAGWTLGPFLYFLMAPSQLIGSGLSSYIIFLEFLLAVSAAFTSTALWRHRGLLSAFIFFLFFHSNHLFVSQFENLWHPILILPFVLGALLLLLRDKPGHNLGAGILLGLAVQLHGSILLLLLGAAVGILIKDRRWQPTLCFLLAAFGAVVLSKIPGWIAGSYSNDGGAVFEFLPVAYHKFSGRLEQYWHELTFQPSALRAFFVRALTVFGLPVGFLYLFKSVVSDRPKMLRSVAPILGALAFTAPLMVPYLLYLSVPRYALPFSLAFCLFSAWSIPDFSLASKAALQRIFLLSLAAGITLLLSPLDRNTRHSTSRILSLSENEEICSAAKKVGLNSMEALRFRIFAVGISLDTITPSLCFNAIKPDKSDALADVGLIVVANQFLMQDYLPLDFFEEMNRRKVALRLIPPNDGSALQIYSYAIETGSRFPAGIFNVGLGYPGVFQGSPIDRNSVFNLPSEKPDFQAVVPELEGRLRIWRKSYGLEVFLEADAAATSWLDIKVGMSRLLATPTLVLPCEDGALSLQMAEFLGAPPRGNAVFSNHANHHERFLLAPLRRMFPVQCPGRLQSVLLGFSASVEIQSGLQSRMMGQGTLRVENQ